MIKNISFVIYFCAIFILIPPSLTIYAKEVNVKDCLDADEDCLEEIGQPVEEMNNEDSIVGSQTITAGSFALNFAKMIIALLLVLALIYFLVTLLKKRNTLFRQIHILENLGGIPLGQNKSIQLVRIGSKIYLIGVGDNVEMLQELTDESVKKSLLEKDDVIDRTPVLQRLFQTKKRLQTRERQDSANTNFTNTLQEELTKLTVNRNKLIHNLTKKDDEHV